MLLCFVHQKDTGGRKVFFDLGEGRHHSSAVPHFVEADKKCPLKELNKIKANNLLPSSPANSNIMIFYFCQDTNKGVLLLAVSY